MFNILHDIGSFINSRKTDFDSSVSPDETAIPLAIPPIAAVQVLVDDETHPASDAITELAETAWSIKQEFEDCKARLEAINQQLTTRLGAGYTLILPEKGKISLSNRETVTVSDLRTLYGLLGSRTMDLVMETVTYRPTQKLLDLVSDADIPNVEALRACLKFSQGITVNYRKG